MALINYTDLKTQIEDWLERDDLSTKIPDFISLAEMKIHRKLHSLDEEVITHIPTVDTDTYAIPDGTKFIKDLYIDTVPKTVVDYLTPRQFNRHIRGNESGMPSFYTIQSGNIVLSTSVGNGNNIVLTHEVKYAPLSDTNLTNWLTVNAMDALLYGSLLEAEAYIKDDERLKVWGTAYTEVISDIEEEENSKRYGGDDLRMRAV